MNDTGLGRGRQRTGPARALPAALLLLAGACSERVARPDVVLVVVDTLRADHVGAYGAARPTTPHLDALAQEGARYARAHAHSGWTLPAMGSLLTGTLPHEHGMGRDADELAAFGRLPEETPTLAELLAESGYDCGAVVNNTFLAPSFGFRRGFGGDYDYRGASQVELRSAEESVDAALAWIEQAEAPRFLLLHFMEPHMWYDPPAGVRGTFAPVQSPPVPVPFGDDVMTALQQGRARLSPAQLDYVQRLYDEEILAVDRALGRLLEALSESPRWGSILVIVTADHGEEFGDHGGWEHGHTLYGELTRVPLVLRGPGVPAGTVVPAPVQHVDVFRTILARAGVTPPPGSHGRVLLEGGAPDPRPVLLENVLYGPPRMAILEGGHAAHLTPGSSPEVWALDAAGIERQRLSGAEAEAVGRRLRAELLARRGSLEPFDATGALQIGSPAELEQLRSLGYIGGRDR